MFDSSIVAFITQLTVPWLIYVILVFVLSWYYREYVIGGTKRWTNLVKTLLIIFSVIMFLYAFYIVYNLIKYPILSGLTIVFMLLAIFAYKVKIGKYECEKEEENEINGIKYILCHTNIVNAWYDQKTRKIYVSSALAERLTNDELKAVVYHEEGHARNKWLSWLSIFLFGLWIFALAGIMIILALLWRTPLSIQEFLIGISSMYWIASILTLFAMTPSWIAEHESDRRALEKAGLDPIINALIKVEIYGTLKGAGLLEVVDNCQIKNINNPQEIREKTSSLIGLAFMLLFYGLMFPKWIGEYVQKPIYYTHPPLQLRIAFLLNRVRTIGKSSKNIDA